MLYFAFGSNLNKSQMSRRCPAAIPIGALVLPNARLVFRGVADIEPSEGDSVQGGLWHITKQCERELDRYEGVSSRGGGLYRKEYLQLGVTRGGKQAIEPCLVYIMNRSGYGEPGDYYFDTIAEGFRDFGLDMNALVAAGDFKGGRFQGGAPKSAPLAG